MAPRKSAQLSKKRADAFDAEITSLIKRARQDHDEIAKRFGQDPRTSWLRRVVGRVPRNPQRRRKNVGLPAQTALTPAAALQLVCEMAGGAAVRARCAPGCQAASSRACRR